jgi:hypothetical protein
VRYFGVALTDNDGESHEYYFAASHMWQVTDHIARTMGVHGDFYGHKKERTIELAVTELVSEPAGGVLVQRLR